MAVILATVWEPGKGCLQSNRGNYINNPFIWYWFVTMPILVYNVIIRDRNDKFLYLDERLKIGKLIHVIDNECAVYSN